LFSGFLTCGICGGAITVVTGGHGSSRYGCVRSWKNGTDACANRLTVRAKVADATLLDGLQAELLRPETTAYVVEQVTAAYRLQADQRPRLRAELERAKTAATEKLSRLISAIEAGAASPSVLQAIADREAEILSLDQQLAALSGPPDDRLAIIPTWVRRQLEDAAGLLRDARERAKAQFQALGVRFTLRPVSDEGPRPFYRGEGSSEVEQLMLRRQNVDVLPLRGRTACSPARTPPRKPADLLVFRDENSSSSTGDRLHPR
jgi:hypothetical protein